MVENFRNDDKQNIMKREENSNEDLIQFSHSESHLENEKHVSDKQIFKPSNQYKAATKFEKDLDKQMSTEVVYTRQKQHEQQVKYPPKLFMSCSGIDPCRSSALTPTYKTTVSSETKTGQNPYAVEQRSSRSKVGQRCRSELLAERLSPTDKLTPGLNEEPRRNHTFPNKANRRNESNLPKFPQYETYEERVSSFKFWPPQIKQTKEQMAASGLYYTGSNDSVQCFQCGGKLWGWEEGDDIWTEHARFFPLCLHVKTNKGKEFVSLVQASIKENGDLYGRSRESKYVKDMGFSEADFLYAIRHLQNTGNFDPTRNEIANILCQLNN